MLRTLKCFLFTSLLRGFVIYSQDQSGFISIDCGRLDRASYNNTRTSITYVSDATFIDSGESKSISPEYSDVNYEQHQYLRSFPQGKRNCYKINNITKGKKYLIRATFVYGNYDGLNRKPEFDLYLGANLWDSVALKGTIGNFSLDKEIVNVPLRNYLHVCVVNTSRGTPFISTIELRPLNLSYYETQTGSLALYYRWDTGPKYLTIYRYPDDVHDRIWYVDPNTDWANITNSSLVVASDEDAFRVPSPIMSTAATPKNTSGSLEYPLFDGTKEYYAYLHFAELESLLPSQSRQFTVSYRGVVLGTISPAYLQATTMSTYNALRGGENIIISRTTNSTHPPIINAIEIYELKQFLQSDTLQTDADAMMTLKSAYGIKRNWQGDPCVPEFYTWEGLNCSKYGSDPPRIISLDLSSSGLTGETPLAISNLTMLEVLDLSDNNFTGSVPEFLSRFPNLKILNLEKNNLYGSVPDKLLEKNNSGSLELSVGQNPNLCVSVSCEKKKKNIVVPVVASVAGTITLLVIVAAVYWGIKRKLKHFDVTEERSTTPCMKLELKERQFTWSDIVRITNNFERILGSGGFGSVFHGLIDSTEVAVKVLSHSSVQGYEQFHTEANLLMRIHHRNLTSLVGYCNDGTNPALIYEYMANGDLKTHLSDDSSSILKWEDRIRIALEVAQGLEYLHAGCKPPIVHRDVKPSNILLNESFQAKLSDLGISKLFLTDGRTHESTLVAGTPGYLDPEYQMTNWLKDKSDVYSYGVVLLEIISGRPAVPKTDERTHISTWVSSMLAKGDIKSIVDRRLDGNFDINSVWKAVEIAMACVSSSSTNRPTMSQVVMELRECLAAEQNFVGMTHDTGFDDFIQVASLNTTSVPQRPQAR